MAHIAARTVTVLALAALLAASVSGHGILASPRMRGALRTERGLTPKVLEGAEDAPISYCPHCNNGYVSSDSACLTFLLVLTHSAVHCF
jgi:hypothetical protein